MGVQELKCYIKENKCKNHFFTGLKEKTQKAKFDYITNHFQYSILNSWNCISSIANNIKVYNLGLTNKQLDRFWEVYEVDSDYLYDYLQENIREFEEMTNTDIYYNGRSGGYLVMVSTEVNSNENVLESLNFPAHEYNTINDYKKDEYFSADDLEYTYYMLKAFDKLCDLMKDNLIYFLDNISISTEIETITKEIKTLNWG